MKLVFKQKPKKRIVSKGGPGSGHHGHSGRPGKIGGSTSGKGGDASDVMTMISSDTRGKYSVGDEFSNRGIVGEVVSVTPKGDPNVSIDYLASVRVVDDKSKKFMKTTYGIDTKKISDAELAKDVVDYLRGLTTQSEFEDSAGLERKDA